LHEGNIRDHKVAKLVATGGAVGQLAPDVAQWG
jgi:hypothetical protein